MELIRPDRISVCTWKPNAKDSPHSKRTEVPSNDAVLPDVLHRVGGTPMVKLNNIARNHSVKCEMLAKCEFFNPGGSVKDRIAYRMVLDAEEKGILKPGCTIIEPTSGNTGIGLAMVAAVRGYRCIIVMPEKMSNEKAATLRALGAEIVRTPTEAGWDHPDGHISTSQKLQKQIPNSVILDQYTNAGNPLAHYDQTAVEIFEQCGKKVDYIVAGAGTGGTISGIGRKFRELSPNTKIIAVDPVGSILAHPHHLNEDDVKFYEVEGIGYDFIPTVLDHKVVDTWVKATDKESLNAARWLIKEEGLLCGGSSGSALAAALKIAKDLPEDKRVVVLLPDGIRNYLTKFVDDYWMEVRGFVEPPEPTPENKWWWYLPLSSLELTDSVKVIGKSTTCQEALQLLTDRKNHRLLVTDEEGCVKGTVDLNGLTSKLIAKIAKTNDKLEKVINKQFARVDYSMKLGLLSRILEREGYAVAFAKAEDDQAIGIVIPGQLLDFINKNSESFIQNSNDDH